MAIFEPNFYLKKLSSAQKMVQMGWKLVWRIPVGILKKCLCKNFRFFWFFYPFLGRSLSQKNRFFLTLRIIAAKMQRNCVSRKVTTLTWSAYNQETILQKSKDFDHANIFYACFCEPIWYSHSEYSRKKTTQTKRLYFFAR